MALTSDRKREFEVKDENQRLRSILATLMIAGNKPGQSPGDDRTKEPYDKDWPPPAPLKPKLAHGGPFYNEYGQSISDPSKGHSHNGVPLPQIEHLKQTPEEMKKNEKRHNQNYPHPSHDLQVSSRQDKLIRGIQSSYGKQGGQYQDEDKLLKNLLMIGELNRKV